LRLLFAHIEKCGGTSIHRHLSQKVPNYVVLKPTPRHGTCMNVKQLKFISKILRSSEGFGGHRLRIFEDYFNEKIIGLIVLRDPIERYKSHLIHAVQRGICNNENEFISNDYYENFMTKRISNSTSSKRAIELLLSKKINVLILEKDFEFLSKENKALSVKNISIDRELIKEKNKEDLLLYQYFINQLKRKNINEILMDFDNKPKPIGLIKKIFIQNIIQEIAFFLFGNKGEKKIKRGE